MKRTIQRWMRNIAGLLLVLLGVIGGFIPVLQGWVFIVLGLSLIEHPLKHRTHQWLKRRSRLYRRIALVFFRVRRKLHRRP